jgi:hypothetical protein
MAEKIIYFANFNITFGKEDEPMLTHFEDIIFPAFNSELTRGGKEQGNETENTGPVYSLQNIEIKKTKDGQYVMVGNCIKDTEYTIHTTLKDGKLAQTPGNIPTAPYSRFIVFLRNHRMVLIKNENYSPDIKSFQATVRIILNKYIRMINKENKEKDLPALPFANVNIVDMKLKDDIIQTVDNLSKINKLKLRFFPLNNDNDPLLLTEAVRRKMKDLSSRTANMNFNNPESSEDIKEFLFETTGSGLAIATLEGLDLEGEPVRVKENTFTSSRKIEFNKNVESTDDEHIISVARKNSSINITSEENDNLYNNFIRIFNKFMRK